MPVPPSDPFNLQRFVDAQEASYARALHELRAGRKRTHWIWYILPQVQGLGLSAMSMRYAICSLAEAQAYLANPVLGNRLRECVKELNSLEDLTVVQVLGDIDTVKFRSCLTLFAQASPSEPIFSEALKRHFGGQPDQATLEVLARQEGKSAA